jgi:hypothetical protein
MTSTGRACHTLPHHSIAHHNYTRVHKKTNKRRGEYTSRSRPFVCNMGGLDYKHNIETTHLGR